MNDNRVSIPMQATIGGIAANSKTGGDTVFAELDVASGVLLVDAFAVVPAGSQEKRRGGAAVVTNNKAAEDYDLLFTEDDMREAIADYFNRSGRGLLVLDDSVTRMDPSQKIDPDGVDDHGRKYRIAPDITNGQLAVIVLCWFAERQGNFARQISAFDDYADVGVTTVGMTPEGKEIASYAMGGTLPIGRDGWPV